MPPLPFSASSSGAGFGFGRFGGRRFGRFRSSSAAVEVDSVFVGVDSVLVDSLGRAFRSSIGRLGRARLRRRCRRGDHDDRDDQADDHRDQAGDQQAEVAARRAAAGPSGGSGWRIIRVGSSCIAALLLRAEDRVEDLAGVVDLEAAAQPLLDLLPLGAGDRHLGRQQAGAGRAGASRGAALLLLARSSGSTGSRWRTVARLPGAAGGSSSSASSRSRSATIRSARSSASSSLRRASRSASSITFEAACSAASTISARRAAASSAAAADRRSGCCFRALIVAA